MKLFSDQMPVLEEPLPDTLLLRVGWVGGLAMTGACLTFTLGALALIFVGKGVLAFFALFVFAPGLVLGWRQFRTGGYFVVLGEDRMVRSDYGRSEEWRWLDLEQCVSDTRKGVDGVWCRKKGGLPKDDIFIEPGGRGSSDLANLLNRYHGRALKRANRRRL